MNLRTLLTGEAPSAFADIACLINSAAPALIFSESALRSTAVTVLDKGYTKFELAIEQIRADSQDAFGFDAQVETLTLWKRKGKSRINYYAGSSEVLSVLNDEIFLSCLKKPEIKK